MLSENIRNKAVICRELIKLCDNLLLDLSYKITPAKQLLSDALKSPGTRHLTFISSDNISEKKLPSSALSKSENEELCEFLFMLGKSDVSTQKKLIEGFKEYINNSLKAYTEKYRKNSKIYVSFGVLFSALFSLIWS